MHAVPVNLLAVLVAALANYIIGTLWYTVLFGASWSKLSGIAEMKPSIGPIVLGFIGALLMSYVLAHALVYASSFMSMSGIGAGLMCGFFNWIGFIAPVTLGVVIYEKKSWGLWCINNSYWLVSLLVMGVILSLWK
jgi:hypothetical protein